MKRLVICLLILVLLIAAGIMLNSRPTPLPPEVSAAVSEEFDLWKKQFHLGDIDRAERLELQNLTERDMRQRIREAQLEEAQIEKQMPPISEAEARAWFEAHREDLRIPARYRVSHLFLTRHNPKKPDRSAEMRAIHQKLLSGMDFAKLVSQHSEDARSKPLGGDLGWLSATRMPADIMAHVEKLRVGETSPPLESKLGWHLLRVTERREARLPSFEEVRSEIEALLDLQQRTRAISSPSSPQAEESR
jgi:parvulin-like peptidyl-prolyl isomerase